MAQQGSIYLHDGTWYLKYRIPQLKDGSFQRVHKTVRLCMANGQEHHPLCAEQGEHRHRVKNGKIIAPKNLDALRGKLMQAVNVNEPNPGRVRQGIRVAEFWDRYLAHLTKPIDAKGGLPRMKPSTIRGSRQIWNQHLKNHFGDITLRAYTPRMGTRFLGSLSNSQCKTTLKHIKALGCSIFKLAVEEELLEVNPWHDVLIPSDAIESNPTKHYTLEEAGNIISALKDHPDCQLVIALSCFLGLRPGEIAALRWEDFDNEYVHIRRSVVRGHVDVPKTPESIAPLPLIDQVRVPLELWRQKSGNPSAGYVFESKNGTPVDLHNLIARVIRPHVGGKTKCIPCGFIPKASGVWKTLYAGRRGACTAAIEATGGNYAVAQALLRHKSMKTTLDVYKKQITPQAFKTGMKLLEAAAKKEQ